MTEDSDCPSEKKKKRKQFLPQEIEIKGHDAMCTYRCNLVFQDIFRELIVKLCIQAKNWPSQTLLRGKNRRVALKGSLLEHAPKQFGFCVANTKWV